MDHETQIFGQTDYWNDQGARGWCEGIGPVTQLRHQRCHVLQIQGESWWHDSIGCQEAASAGRREPQAEAITGRYNAGQCGTEESCNKTLLTPNVKRRAVHHVIDGHGLSESRACRLAGLDRSTFQYQKQSGRDKPLRKRLRELANERPLGYRRLAILLEREGMKTSHKKVFRIYREEGLAVRRRQGCKPAVGTRRPIVVPDRPISVGASTLYLTSWQVDDGTARYVLLTTSRARLWHSLRPLSITVTTSATTRA